MLMFVGASSWTINKFQSKKEFGLGVEFALEIQNTGVPKLYNSMGGNYVKIAEVNWGKIELNSPKNGVHSYNWEWLDSIVRDYQKYGFNIQMVLFTSLCANGDEPICWALEKAPTDSVWNPSTPPKENHWEDYRLWIQAIVERYDYDGQNDMPGLKRPILEYEIGNEVCHEGFWQVPKGKDRIEEYKKLLSNASSAAKSTNPDVKIILGGISFLSLFDGIPNETKMINRFDRLYEIEPIKEDVINFTFETLKETNSYDLIDCHYNYDYKGYYKTVEWIRKYSDKPIWAGDTVIGPLVAPAFKLPEFNHYPNGFLILQVMNDPLDQLHFKIKKWYREEQAIQSFKKLVVMMDLNIKGGNLGNVIDWPKYPLPDYCFQGMADTDYVKKKIGTPRPVYYSIKQFKDILMNHNTIERLNINGNVLNNKGVGVWAFKFRTDNKSIYVIWYDSGIYECPNPICHIENHGNITIDLSSYISSPNVKTTSIVTELDNNKNPIYSSDIFPANSIQISERPIIIELEVKKSE
jgi:hypothetical protein